MNKNTELTGVSNAQKFSVSPFVDDVFKIDSKRKTIIAGRTNKILLDSETGEMEGVALLHRYKEVDQEKFVKLYLSEVTTLFELSASGIKVFSYLINVLPINLDTVYIHIPDLMDFCKWRSKKPAYRGLGELINNKIIAMSTRPGLWYINPTVIFNGDRVAFIKEYRLVKKPKNNKSEQLLIEGFMKNEE